MNLFRLPALARVKPLMQDQSISNWIDHIAMPLAASVMETQPIALVLLAGSLLLAGQSQSFPLEAGSITLLMLGLYWWALLVERIAQTRAWKPLPQALSLLGLLLALAVVMVTHLSLLQNFPALLLVAALIIWLWQRSISRAQMGFDDEKLIISFRVGFLTLIAILCLAVLNFLPEQSVLLNAFVLSIPIYFLSGLIALSLPRLKAVGIGERTRFSARSQVGSRGHARFLLASSWLSLLLSLVLIPLVVAIVLEFIAFQSLVSGLSALWSLLSGPLSAIDAFITWLLSLSRPAPVHRVPCVRNTPHCKVLPSVPLTPQPYHNPLLVVIVLVFLLLVLMAIVITVLRSISLVYRSEDEQRQWISLRALFKRRRRQKRRKDAFELEALEPDSVRMRYRELLQAMARRDDLARRPEETAIEYRERLTVALGSVQVGTTQKGEIVTDMAILDELTHAYLPERYGEKRSDMQQRTYLRMQLPLLLKRLTRTKFPRVHGQK